MKKYLMLGASLASLALAGTASARDGWYVGVEAGLGAVDKTTVPGERCGQYSRCNDNIEVESIVISPYGSRDISFDNGFAGFLTVGKGFKERWRVEGELGIRDNESDWYGGTNKLRETSWMMNVLYDSKPFSEKWTVSLGAGAGIDDAEFRDAYGYADDSTSFAAQGILGLTYRLNERWDAMTNFRYLWVDDPSFHTSVVDGGLDLRKESITFGLRYSFGSAPQPLRSFPPEPPRMPNQFIIFFGYDKCAITPAADQVLTEAATVAKAQGSAAVAITGHTDTMGSVAYNARLSQCRSKAAADNLVSKGIPPAAIVTSGAGESQLLIKTGDDTKEPQNRRAVIDVAQ